jgi:Spy/CpxP family protein refolding chaperone
MRTISTVLVATISLAIVGTLAAAEQGKGAKGKRSNASAPGIFFFVLKLDLTADQKAKVAELQKEYGPKLQEGFQKQQDLLTDEQRKAQQDATKAARDAGKSETEARAAGQAAVKLTDDQKAKRAEMQKEMAPLMKEAREKVTALLTPEQQEKLQKSMPQVGGGAAKKANQ